MKIIFVRGGAEGAVEAAKELLANAQEGLQQEAKLADAEATVVEKSITTAKGAFRRQIEEIERRHEEKVSYLQGDVASLRERRVRLEGKVRDVEEALSSLS